MDKSRINILSEEVVGKISAGEVVERPASVVKELIENSIDAGSDSIEIQVESAGQMLIRVADNGRGMNPEELKMACLPHATSKIRQIPDLDNIRSLGFRGEALASIAAVSQMELTSCCEGSDSGFYVYLESGQLLRSRPAGRSKGTTVEVRNLFYNVPARRKFLNRESTELAEIANVVGRFILSYENIEFRLKQSDRCLLHAGGDLDAAERIRLVLGGDFADHLMGVSCSGEGFSIRGFASLPSCTRRDKRGQLFFVNGRFVRSKLLSDAVFVAYRSMLERGKYPSVVLFTEIDPSSVDVNVHPAKLEIKFDDEKTLKNAVIRSIKNEFDSARKAEEGSPDLSSETDLRSQTVNADSSGGPPEEQSEFSYDFTVNEDESQKKEYILREVNSFRDDRKTPADNIYQVADCYIVRLAREDITITDQHAAHERILYEYLRGTTENSPIETQNLLFPIRMELSARETILMEKVIDNFRDIGFLIEPFGERSFIVQSVPALIKDRDIKTVVEQILNDLFSVDLSKVDPVNELIKLTSCRAAIKAGDKLSREEMHSLVQKLEECELPFTCPHGRPTMTTIGKKDLEKMFRRK
ncbi:MAG: DNA mismatch repair endonuclease MutL [Candidatus Omnitrophica bacterium]|nr:DNA mismatch repair endonuclease MutL [Candidatus Omnitrophota bacterium]